MPIATLLIVAEMTGDYTMLVPTALAVMVSHFVQASLCRPFKYKSLYGAQAPTRSDSPAHHTEQLEVAFDLLSRHPRMLRPPGVLELTSLLSSGGSYRLSAPPEESEIVLALRGGEVLWPGTDTHMEVGDRLLVVTSEPAWASICQRDLEPPHA